MSKNTFHDYSSSGFTLLESLVVIVFISILSAIALPSWQTFVDRERLNTAQDQIYRAMQQTQSQAKKQKLTWQISFKEQNGVVQWASHPAQTGAFIPSAVLTNNSLWHNLEQNIRIDQQKNNLGKDETTLPKQTSIPAWRVMFNYQGCPVYQVGDECTQTAQKTLGKITLRDHNNAKTKRCVYVSTLLGALRMGKDHPTANEDNRYCY
ncbi:pilus assembly FimT family protein [Iningainema tapete]|uniref:Type II secretion system protein n=1 Tax=Iningainema tapete BLCC-T55 TaxID=2748662 RepID=A0A8J6XJH7_9CYAN|nr:type II secretion system protein [Iningainema tapete]MBD2771457.1 type II secretion system protein [Iningainema tapete BLCC-T55]